MSKILTVFGATGKQGGSVIRTILQDAKLSQEFRIRGITRDTTKLAAQALSKQGVELRNADMNSKESLVQALQGSHSVFLVTTPAWGVAGSDAELVHGKNATDAAKATGVQHLIFSSLLNVTETSGGRLKHVPHFDQKAQVEQYIRSTGVPATFVLPGYFMSNYPEVGMLRKGEDGVYNLAYPVGQNAKFPLVDIEADMGKYVAAALKNPSESLGAQILAAEDYYTPTRILQEFEEVTGQKARFVQVDPDTFKSFMPGPIGEEMLQNHLFIENPGYFNGRDLKESNDWLEKAGYQPTSWREFLERNKAAFLQYCSPRGIGYSLCCAFKAKGLRVFATARRLEDLAGLKAKGIETLALTVDDAQSVLQCYAEIERRVGSRGLDYLVNNAGRNYTVPAMEVDLQGARQILETNFFAVILMCQTFLPLLLRAKGTIVQIGSVSGVMPYVFGSVYNASKAALHSLSDAMRIELAPFG
ncbi:hypothetical protein KXV88_001931 [Aspergillus fumigatus]|nr:hypothetical protein KXV88_001931 [Aspergillus fumigatus]